MSLLGNLIWIILGGIIIFLEYLLEGVLLCLTVVGIPFGIQLIRLSFLALLPFGKEVTSKPQTGCLALVMNIIWILIGGIWIALEHLILAMIFAVTIIGIPFAKQHIKLAQLAFTPFSKEVK